MDELLVFHDAGACYCRYSLYFRRTLINGALSAISKGLYAVWGWLWPLFVVFLLGDLHDMPWESGERKA